MELGYKDQEWIAKRIESEHQKHSRTQDWCWIAATKIVAIINDKLATNKENDNTQVYCYEAPVITDAGQEIRINMREIEPVIKFLEDVGIDNIKAIWSEIVDSAADGELKYSYSLFEEVVKWNEG